MRLAAAQRADIEAAGVERRLQREIVDLGIMRERGERGVAVERPRLQHVLRPFGMERHVGKAVRRGEGRARIDDLDVESRRSCAIGASAWLICTAPITTSRGCGRCTLRKKFRPSASTEPEAPERKPLGDRLAELAGDLRRPRATTRSLPSPRSVTRIAARRARRACVEFLQRRRIHQPSRST